jgi:hypothetical protein
MGAAAAAAAAEAVTAVKGNRKRRVRVGGTAAERWINEDIQVGVARDSAEGRGGDLFLFL